jgi:hypothetical protein
MYDLKPEAPREYRGEFLPIPTKVPGLDICELMPRQAQIADKFTLIRSMKFQGGHNPYELLSGFPAKGSMDIKAAEKWPVFGSVVSRLQSGPSAIPPYVNLNELRLGQDYDDPEVPRYLGTAHQPFRPSGPGFANLKLAEGVTVDSLANRRVLLSGFDRLRRQAELRSDQDQFANQALDIVMSGKIHEALDLNREDQPTRELYGKFTNLLLARRLVEAGVSVITVGQWCTEPVAEYNYNVPEHWDTHSWNFPRLRANLPAYDQAIYALLTDLYQRGLDEKVAVVIWGEFGRTPLFGTELGGHGRNHWPSAGFALMAGGGFHTGQVIGATDPRAEMPIGKPYTPQNVLATLYRFLGIDPAMTFPDFNGRPTHLLDDRDGIHELS